MAAAASAGGNKRRSPAPSVTRWWPTRPESSGEARQLRRLGDAAPAGATESTLTEAFAAPGQEGAGNSVAGSGILGRRGEWRRSRSVGRDVGRV